MGRNKKTDYTSAEVRYIADLMINEGLEVDALKKYLRTLVDYKKYKDDPSKQPSPKAKIMATKNVIGIFNNELGEVKRNNILRILSSKRVAKNRKIGMDKGLPIKRERKVSLLSRDWKYIDNTKTHHNFDSIGEAINYIIKKNRKYKKISKLT